APGSLIDPPNRFPTLEGVDVPVHETAETYMRSGESLLARLLPYWAVRLVVQLRILILPLLAMWRPFLKSVARIYNLRADRRLTPHYAARREAEGAIARADNPDDLRDRLGALDRLRSDMERLSRKVPAHLQRDVYHWRLHVAAVRSEAQDRLARMGGRRGSARPGPSPGSSLIPDCPGEAATGPPPPPPGPHPP